MNTGAGLLPVVIDFLKFRVNDVLVTGTVTGAGGLVLAGGAGSLFGRGLLVCPLRKFARHFGQFAGFSPL